MKKNQIIIMVSLIVIIAILVVAAFVIMPKLKKDDYSKITVTSKEMMDKIVTNLGEQMPKMMDVTKEDFTTIYGINLDKLDNYSAQMPMMNIRVNEVVIVKVKDIKDVEEVKSKLKTRSEAVAKTFETYLADQYEIAKAPIITSKGKYVLMTISEKKDDIEKIFNSYFEKK
ncbi:MAG: DUF4358 domain-containing protein [Clostridia bacterium]